jgi:hypothetical protein
MSILPSSPSMVRVGKAVRTYRVLDMTVIACVSIITGCASPQHPPTRGAGAVAPAPVARAEARGPDDETGTTPSASPIPPELQRMVRSVRALEESTQEPAHERLTRSVRDAADALDAFEPGRMRAGAALRAASDRIEASGVDSPDHAEELRNALVAARERLRAHGSGAQRAKAPAPPPWRRCDARAGPRSGAPGCSAPRGRWMRAAS